MRKAEGHEAIILSNEELVQRGSKISLDPDPDESRMVDVAWGVRDRSFKYERSGVRQRREICWVSREPGLDCFPDSCCADWYTSELRGVSDVNDGCGVGLSGQSTTWSLKLKLHT